eukprot:9013833-Pyramimonas_sp.AAC.1
MREARECWRNGKQLAGMDIKLNAARSTKLLGAMYSDRNDLAQEIAARTISLQESEHSIRLPPPRSRITYDAIWCSFALVKSQQPSSRRQRQLGCPLS